ncbi:MAG: DoxX family protein [Ignavibacteria bacterium]|nr:DoxX family protein [Ignavibacteria bacterium]MCC7158322.1 DoxX family protein [Ignavibacteria bacterium]
MNILTGVVARIFFAIPFLGFGIGHLMNAGQMAGMVPIPGGVIWIYVTGISMILAGLAAITKIQGKLAMLLLALLLLTYILTIHIPAMMKPETMMMGMMGFYKDAGLMGGALLLAGIFHRESNKASAA